MTSRTTLMPLLLVAVCLRGACAGSHSLRYFYSAVSAPALPQFSVAGFVDDAPIVGYSSESRKCEPRAAWMEENEGPQYWERETQIFRGSEPVHKADVRTVMGRLNHTRGLHTVQVMYGCELGDDGSTGGFSQYAYDGRDFISLHKDTLSWVAAMPAAEITQQRWNADRSIAEQEKGYLEGLCIEALQRYLLNGKETLQRRERPETMVSHHKSGASNARLTCHAYKFYPREIEVKWFRNGVEMPAKFLPQTLPNPDGTYQIKTTVEVPEGEEEMYICRVDHSSLDNALDVKYEKKALPIGLIIGAIAGVVVLLAAAIGGIVIWRKRSAGRGGYAAANKGPINADSSSSTASA
uniref:MHC class I antigen n=1 Tax=Andrias davidianus TaxID=141262 RepID=U5QAP2_ANDDA|nr:MHC class I antigen [Andrias davidianus]